MRTVLSLGLLVLLSSCGGVEAPDDAGDAAFVQQVVPAVLGRKVHGSMELNVLTQLVQAKGRDALLDVLFEQPEYVSYWSTVLATRLEVAQEGTFAESSSCFNVANIMSSSDPADADALVYHLRNDPASSTYSTSFTMADVLIASVMADDLSGAYRAWILPLAKNQFDTGWTNRFIQSSILGRNSDCQGCHSTAWSTTDDAAWDRFHGTPINLEKGVYGSGGDFTNACGSDWACQQIQSPSGYCYGCHGGDGTEAVTGDDGRDKTLSTRVPVLSYGQTHATILNGTAGGMPDLGLSSTYADYILWYMEGEVGYSHGLSEFFNTPSMTGGSLPLGMASACSPTVNTAHTGATYPSWFAGQKPAHPSPNDLLDAYIDGLAGVQGEVAAVGLDYSRNPWETPTISGPASFAYLAAAHSVDTIAQEVMGQRYTLSHGYSRTGYQALYHDVLTMQFIQNGWSLQETIRSLVMSNSFNRRAPEDSLVTSTAYPLLPLFNPWALTQPGTATGAHSEDRNGTGDLVHRYPPDNLYRSAADAFGWYGAAFIGNAYGPASLNVQRGIGDYLDYYAPGFDRWSMQSLLWWEASYGTCNASGDYSWDPDWIANLAYYAPAAGLTFEETFELLRDRMLGNPSLTTVESTELAAIISPAPMTGLASTAGYSAMDAWLRQYCGVLIKSPDFLLAGVPTVTTAINDFPEQPFCWYDEPCDIAEMCTYWEGELAALGDTWYCDETPGVIDPIGDPVEAADYASIEKQVGNEWGYDWETDYAEEIYANAKAEYAETPEVTREEPLSAGEQARVSKYNLNLRENAGWWTRANTQAERWRRSVLPRVTATESLGFEEPEWAGEVAPSVVEAQTERQRIMTDVAAAERTCLATKHVSCPTASWSPVATSSTGGSGEITKEHVDATKRSYEEAEARRDEAESVGDGGNPQPEMKIERIR